MRYHPLTIAFRIYQFVKNSFFIILLLFVLRKDSEFWLFEYGRYAFISIAVLRLIHIVLAWFVEKYEWHERTFHLYKGVFVKQTNTIPFSKVQNVTRKTTVFHKILGVTSITFETAMDGEDDSIHFDVVTKDHANYLTDLVRAGKENETETTNHIELEEQVPVEEPVSKPRRTIHFTPERKDLWKASFTSLSFLAIIPIAFGAWDYIQPFLPDEDEVEGILQLLLASKWLVAILIILLVFVAVGFGVARTFIRFGKYEISSDATHIYIERGVLDESQFVIEKRKIQGLEITQTWIKRLFGLAEVKLISSSNRILDGEVNVNSLYPFLPVAKAYQLIEELMPSYQLDVALHRLPRNALWVKLVRPSWVWIIATIALIYFKPDLFQIKQAWWIAIIGLFVLIVVQRILDYVHTKYAFTEDQVLWWHGGFTSSMFITKRKNVIEMNYSQSVLQRFFSVASVTTINRSIPPRHETIQDIPFEYAAAMNAWYLQRRQDVQVK
ncbi:PH domain-containing protein [Ornithinibacillus sp. JPR2-1]|uniref:PH domain-containing protein n=1 Tax=Ornithinibacillus sp. JPR2-1 TaxID=2094019 RepID=UPI0031E39DA1